MTGFLRNDHPRTLVMRIVHVFCSFKDALLLTSQAQASVSWFDFTKVRLQNKNDTLLQATAPPLCL
jgi:hypothetical protein